MRKRHCSASLGVVAALVFATAGLAASLHAATAWGADDAPSAANDHGAVLGTSVFETRGRVVRVDPDSNSVTLTGERGTRFTFEVEPEVADVSKLAPGDQVDVVYRHALLMRVDSDGSSGVRSRVDTTTTTPAMGGVSTTTHSVEVTATIRKIDRARRRVTLRGPSETIELDVPPNVEIGTLRVGQKVRASYVTQSAVKVTRDGQPVH